MAIPVLTTEQSRPIWRATVFDVIYPEFPKREENSSRSVGKSKQKVKNYRKTFEKNLKEPQLFSTLGSSYHGRGAPATGQDLR